MRTPVRVVGPDGRGLDAFAPGDFVKTSGAASDKKATGK